MKDKEESYSIALTAIAFFFIFLISLLPIASATSSQNSSPMAQHAYVTNYDSNAVSVIDTVTNTITTVVNVGAYPWGVAINPEGTKVYVAKADGNVSVIDTVTNNVTATVEVGSSPYGIAVSPDGTKVYVTNNGNLKFPGKTVSVIDTANNTVTATINVGNWPCGVAVSPDGTKVYVTNSSSPEVLNNSVSVIDTATNTVISTVNVGSYPTGITVNPEGTRVYVTKGSSNTVSVIDIATNKITATVDVGIIPLGVAVSPDGKKVYVTNLGSNNISVLDTAANNVTTTVNVGIRPIGVSVTPDGKKVYVANSDSNTISVIDTATNTVTATVPVEGRPISFGQFISYVPVTEILPAAVPNSNVTSGYIPLCVQFTDLSQNIISRIWDVGNDGTIESTDASFVYEFSSKGTYPVRLTVTTESGSSSEVITISALRKSSSGSSGGAGGSPEPQKNVEVKELSQVFITNDKPIKFDFTRNATSVIYVSFDSKKTVGRTTTIVEMLKNKSTLTPNSPEGGVYNYLNIWVGNSGYATEKNIENTVVCFKVEKSWVQDKHIDQSSIALNRFNDNKWNELPTSLSDEDNQYLYFTAQTPGLSPFAITGKTIVEKADTEIPPEFDTKDIENNGSSTINVEQEPEKEQSTRMPSFEIVYGILGLLGSFLYRRR
ncbi:PGF-pre-PGF domain-containing protein [Methanosarcina sp. DH2]|jgi:PGF-pre-PGF domain-containing protein|uniref:PGF-pre-PGF domain-containing protein n=1 Tax=Methanosarcina sp. DH2 TaxID=2605639 RepID=UPI001E536B1C|nr:PGF-pre-PGF domain-containing protein [Methanosarcina sp. DH2]MCC4769119.1 PGF-pre-PGF domain-containing protein [Methanosarcina sp. DH2]